MLSSVGLFLQKTRSLFGRKTAQPTVEPLENTHFFVINAKSDRLDRITFRFLPTSHFSPLFSLFLIKFRFIEQIGTASNVIARSEATWQSQTKSLLFLTKLDNNRNIEIATICLRKSRNDIIRGAYNTPINRDLRERLID